MNRKSTNQRKDAYQQGYRFAVTYATPRGHKVKFLKTREEMREFKRDKITTPSSSGEFNEAGFLLYKNSWQIEK